MNARAVDIFQREQERQADAILDLLEGVEFRVDWVGSRHAPRWQAIHDTVTVAGQTVRDALAQLAQALSERIP